MKHLKISASLKLTPGSLRGGGAVSAHRRKVPISDIMWKMRIVHMKPLTFYLQKGFCKFGFAAAFKASEERYLAVKELDAGTVPALRPAAHILQKYLHTTPSVRLVKGGFKVSGQAQSCHCRALTKLLGGKSSN